MYASGNGIAHWEIFLFVIPVTFTKYKGISSGYFLQEVRKMLGNDYEIVNIDSTIFIEKPRMAPYIETMKRNIANLLKIDVERVNVKATRGEKVGPIGKMEAVSSEAIVLIKKVL